MKAFRPHRRGADVVVVVVHTSDGNFRPKGGLCAFFARNFVYRREYQQVSLCILRIRFRHFLHIPCIFTLNFLYFRTILAVNILEA